MSVTSDSTIASAHDPSVLARSPPRRPSGAPRPAATDGELLAVFLKRRDAESLERLVARHSDMVWRVCRQTLRRQQDAEDAFQATFLLLVKHARSIKSSDSAAGWLYRVAHRTSLAARKKLAARREEALALDPLAPAEAAFPDLSHRQNTAALMEELRALPERYQTPLVLRYLEGQSRRAIADQTDSTVAAVQGRLARGKQLLRRRLLRRGVSLSLAFGALASKPLMAEAAPPSALAATTSHSMALATGGSLAASVAVVSLLREGTRAMLFTSLSKPAAGVVVAALVAIVALAPDGVALGANEAGAAAALVFDAHLADEADDDTAVPAFDVAASAGHQGTDAPDKAHWRAYSVEDIIRLMPEAKVGEPAEQKSKVERLAVQAAAAVGLPLDDIKPMVRNNSLVVAGDNKQHVRLSEWLLTQRKALSSTPSVGTRRDAAREADAETRTMSAASDKDEASDVSTWRPEDADDLERLREHLKRLRRIKETLTTELATNQGGFGGGPQYASQRRVEEAIRVVSERIAHLLADKPYLDSILESLAPVEAAPAGEASTVEPDLRELTPGTADSPTLRESILDLLDWIPGVKVQVRLPKASAEQQEAGVSIVVPESYVESVAKSELEEDKTLTAEVRQQAATNVMRRIEEIVKPLLPRLAIGQDEYRQVSVTIMPDAAGRQSVGESGAAVQDEPPTQIADESDDLEKMVKAAELAQGASQTLWKMAYTFYRNDNGRRHLLLALGDREQRLPEWGELIHAAAPKPFEAALHQAGVKQSQEARRLGERASQMMKRTIDDSTSETGAASSERLLKLSGLAERVANLPNSGESKDAPAFSTTFFWENAADVVGDRLEQSGFLSPNELVIKQTIANPKTRSSIVIRRFQHKNDLEVTGKLNEATLDKLRELEAGEREELNKAAEAEPETVAEAPPLKPTDPEADEPANEPWTLDQLNKEFTRFLQEWHSTDQLCNRAFEVFDRTCQSTLNGIRGESHPKPTWDELQSAGKPEPFVLSLLEKGFKMRIAAFQRAAEIERELTRQMAADDASTTSVKVFSRLSDLAVQLQDLPAAPREQPLPTAEEVFRQRWRNLCSDAARFHVANSLGLKPVHPNEERRIWSDFQRQNGLEPTGELNEATWNALFHSPSVPTDAPPNRGDEQAATRPLRFVPRDGATGGSWTVFDQPSELNPDGWAVKAELAPNATAPIPVDEDIAIRPKLLLVEGDDSGLTLRVIDPKTDRQAPEFTIRRDEAHHLTVRGQRVRVVYPSRSAGPDGTDESPMAPILIVEGHAEVDTARPDQSGGGAGQANSAVE